MEDFRHISHLGEVQLDRWRENAASGEAAPSAPGFRFPVRRLLLSLTVVIIGLVAWWGY